MTHRTRVLCALALMLLAATPLLAAEGGAAEAVRRRFLATRQRERDHEITVAPDDAE